MKIVLNKKAIVFSAILYAVVTAALCLICNMINNSSVFNHNIEIWVVACQYIDFFLPVFVPIIYTTVLYYRRKNNFLNYLSTRINKKKYIRKFIISAMFITLLFTTIMYYIGLLYSVFGLEIHTIPGNDYFYNNIFGNLQADSPLSFGLLWCVWKGVIASLFTAFGCFLSLYIDNIFVVIIAPFVYAMAENLITGLLRIPQHGIFTSLDFDRLSPDGMHVYNFFTGVIIFVITATIIILIAKSRARRIYAVY